MELITGYAGQGHITSMDDAIRNCYVAETDGRYVLDGVMNEFGYNIVSANEIDIKSGYGVIQGRYFKNGTGSAEPVTIENGAQGSYRADLICVRYQKNNLTGIETASLVVKKGTPSTSGYTDPEYTVGNILDGDLVDEMPLYRVKINGINIEGVETLFSKLPKTMASIKDMLITKKCSATKTFQPHSQTWVAIPSNLYTVEGYSLLGTVAQYPVNWNGISSDMIIVAAVRIVEGEIEVSVINATNEVIEKKITVHALLKLNI